MELSIVIVNFNTKDLLGKCLDSIAAYGLEDKGNSEVIVVDNGSVDGSVEEINKPKFKARNEKLNLKIIENKDNLGFSKAVNQGLRQAKGDKVLLLNSDTQLTKNSLKNLLEFEKAVHPAVVGSQMLNPDKTVQGSCFFLPTINRAFLEYWLGKRGYFSKYYPSGNAPVEVEAISGGVMLLPKEVIDKVGLLDERYFMYFEDLDYCRRVRESGYKIYYLPSSQIIHEHGASGKKLAEPQNQWRRLIPSSKIYHGVVNHLIITAVIWSGQRLWKVLGWEK
jgi:GT2 family glycosyltransferase